MSYPTNDITTAQLDAATGSIAGSRVELYTALTRLSELINSRNTSDGLAPLDASSLVPNANIPTTLTSGAGVNIILQPGSTRVTIQNVLSLTARTVAQLEADDAPAGSIAYCTNGDAGSPCISVAEGSVDTAGDYQWSRIALGLHVATS
tara:strand:- start:1160 stop:1606 length:447 start_codon:yes stop_codon:yes gene_type:complete